LVKISPEEKIYIRKLIGHKPNLEEKTGNGKEKSNRKPGFSYSILLMKCIVPFLLKES
jgi:hypothetical protein